MQPQQPQVQIDLSNTTGVKCPECKSHFFDQTVIIRKISRLYTGASEDQMTLVPVFVCRGCGVPLKEVFPAGMTDVERDLGLIKASDVDNSKTIQLFS